MSPRSIAPTMAAPQRSGGRRANFAENRDCLPPGKTSFQGAVCGLLNELRQHTAAKGSGRVDPALDQ